MTDHLGVSNPESVPFLRKAHAKLEGNVVNAVKAFFWDLGDTMDDTVCDLWQRNHNEIIKQWLPVPIIPILQASWGKRLRAIEDLEPLKVSLKMATGYPRRHGRRKARPAPFR